MITVISFIFVLSFLIFVHEFGHFAMAKLFGIGVERFSIGYPPKLVGITIGETEYCLSMIPFGGYVKLVGQSDFEQEDEEGEIGPNDYRGKPAPVKIAVLAAGPLMNLLTAVGIFWLVFIWNGVPEQSNRIGYVEPESYAAQIGLRNGDEILEVDGRKVDAVEQAFLSLFTEDHVRFLVNNTDGERNLVTDHKLVEGEQFGISMYLDSRIDRLLPDEPAAKAGLVSGDIITAIDGEQLVGGWTHMSEVIRRHPGETREFTITRGSETLSIPITIGSVTEETPDGTSINIGRIGVTPKIATRDVGPAEAGVMAFRQTKLMIIHMVDFIGKLLTGKMSSKLLGGPVLIAQMAGESARSGFMTLLEFTAFISINLGILNLFPFPVLDGGHIAIITVESLSRRKVSYRFRMAVQQVGTLILFIFMIYVTFNDILRFDSVSKLFGG